MDNPSDRIISGRPAIGAGSLPEGRSFSLSALLSGWSLAIFGAVGCWLLFFNELRGEWDVNEQYSYGYLVPLLGAALFWLRWPDRPAAAPERTWGFAAAGAVLAFFLFPLRLVSEANPDWRLIYWVHGGIMVGLSFCLLYRAGGWAWVKHFAVPVVFMLIAVPWPMQLEQWSIQSLMRLVAGLTVEIVGWLGIPALQHGNLIEVGSGVVGINEACSGVRSLQSALMLSLFLGEMHRFSARRRVALVAVSLGVDLVANVARTTLLTSVAATRGLQNMEALHDRAGFMVMVIVLLSLLAIAHYLRPKSVAAPAEAPKGISPGMMPRWIGLGLIGWLGVSEATTEIWYRTHEIHLIRTPRWEASWPVHSLHFKKTVLPEASLAILRCSNSNAATWQDDDGNEWSAFFLRWEPEKNSAQLAKGHRPDICFPAAGANLLQDFGQVAEDVNGFKMSFHHQTFQAGSHLLNVFYCLSADRVSPAEAKLPEDNSRSSRLQAVLAGKRHLGQQVLEMVVEGPDSPDAAVKSFETQLPAIVQPGQ